MKLYELNCAVYLNTLGESQGKRIYLHEVPESEFLRLRDMGVNSVWLMGAWERSPAATRIINEDSTFISSLNESLGEIRQDDIIGSAYSVRSYNVDSRFGGNQALKIFRDRLKSYGIGLILDFVPNHASPDNIWLQHNSDYFISGTLDDLESNPDYFIECNGVVYAKGRDPTLPAWSDVVQLNAFSSSYRSASLQTLLDIAELCDGVRCDMSMLMINEIFANTWGDQAGERPENEYWVELIQGIRERFPDFSFIAEAYWDTESLLLEQGFDYCYDKVLYDRLRQGVGNTVAAHLKGTVDYRAHLLTFIENHDEARAATIFEEDKEIAAAAVTYTLPGIGLIHDGQIEGFKFRPPVHISRSPVEPINDTLRLDYERLFGVINSWDMDAESMRIIDCGESDILAWQYATNVVIINYSGIHVVSSVLIDFQPVEFKDMVLTDRFSPSGPISIKETSEGLVIDVSLNPWQVQLLDLSGQP